MRKILTIEVAVDEDDTISSNVRVAADVELDPALRRQYFKEWYEEIRKMEADGDSFTEYEKAKDMWNAARGMTTRSTLLKLANDVVCETICAYANRLTDYTGDRRYPGKPKINKEHE